MMSNLKDISQYPQSLRSAAALDQLARDLYVNHRHYLGEPVKVWDKVPYHLRQIYFELAARTLKAMSTSPEPAKAEDALFHLANALGRADMVTGLRPTHGVVIGAIQPREGGAA